MNEFRRGWTLLLGAFLGIATGVSSLYFYSLGIFLKPMGDAFGWTRGQASLGPLVGTLAAAIASPLTGRVIDAAGPQRTATGSMLLLAAGFAALGWGSAGLGSFLALTAIMSLFNVGSSPMSYTRLLVAAFDRHRGVALGIALTGTGVGAALVPALLVPYVATHGWRAGYLALAVTVLIATLPVALLIRSAPGAAGSAGGMVPVALRTLAADPRFRLLALIFFLAATAVLGTIVHFVAMLGDAGIPPARAGALAGSIGLAVIVGRVVAGALLDRFAATRVTAGLFLASAGGMALLAIGGPALALPGALAIGLAVGAEVDLIAYLVSRLFPAAAYGSAYGGIYAMFLVGAAIGPVLTGFLVDATGGYAAPLLVSAGLLAIAALLALRVPLHPPVPAI